MTRLAKIQGDGQGGTYDALMGGINNGLGIAGAMRQRDLDKMQMTEYNRKAEQDALDAPVKDAQRKDALEKLEIEHGKNYLAKMSATELKGLAVGTKFSELNREIKENKQGFDVKGASDYIATRMGEDTADLIKFSYEPVTLADGRSVFRGTVNMGKGKPVSFEYSTPEELHGFLNKTRIDAGAANAAEFQHRALIGGEAQKFWQGLNDTQKKQFGIEKWDEDTALANRNFMAAAGNALDEKLSSSAYMEKEATYSRNAEDQTMAVEKHNLDQASTRLGMDATRLNMANTSQLMSQRSEEHSYAVSQRPLDRMYNQLKVDSAALEKDDKVMDILSTTYPQFAPSVPILDENNADTGKRSFAPSQISDMRVITQMARGYGPEVHPADALFKATERLSKMRLDEAAEKAAKEAKDKEAAAVVPPKLGVGVKPPKKADGDIVTIDEEKAIMANKQASREATAKKDRESLNPYSGHGVGNGKWGQRNDGTEKGNGFLGPLKMKDGSNSMATEISVGVELEGKETEIPLLVPTLTSQEIDHLLKGGKATDMIMKKAVDNARRRMADGLSPFK